MSKLAQTYMPQEYLSTPQILNNGDSQGPQADKVGALIASPTGIPVNITSATTTVVKTSAGVLHKIIVNATSASSITVYDSTAASGTKIATLKASVAEQTFDYDAQFLTGLTIVSGASDITVVYR